MRRSKRLQIKDDEKGRGKIQKHFIQESRLYVSQPSAQVMQSVVT